MAGGGLHYGEPTFYQNASILVESVKTFTSNAMHLV